MDLIIEPILFLWNIIFTFYYTCVRPQCDYSILGWPCGKLSSFKENTYTCGNLYVCQSLCIQEEYIHVWQSLCVQGAYIHMWQSICVSISMYSRRIHVVISLRARIIHIQYHTCGNLLVFKEYTFFHATHTHTHTHTYTHTRSMYGDLLVSTDKSYVCGDLCVFKEKARRLPHIWMSHVTHMNGSCHTHESDTQRECA